MTSPVEPLDPERIARNVRDLRARIGERFEGHAIVRRADRLVGLADRALSRSRELARPHYALRAFCVADTLLLIAVLVVAGYFVVRALRPVEGFELMDLLQGIEAGIGCILFLSVALVFFWTMEKRVRRREALKEIDYLRNFLHLVNMGQLDKEPVRLDEDFHRTDRSPRIRLDPHAMERYLSQTQKLAHYAAEIGCLYANVLIDAEVDRAADQLREFASDVARAAGNKITILVLKGLGDPRRLGTGKSTEAPSHNAPPSRET
jgi:hypothetical protein